MTAQESHPARLRPGRLCTSRWRSGRDRRCLRSRRARTAGHQQCPAAAEPPAGHRQAADHDRDERQVAEGDTRGWWRSRAVDPPVASTIAPKASAAPAALIAGAPIAASSIETVSRAPGRAGADEQDDPGESREDRRRASLHRPAREGHRIGVPEHDRRSRRRRTPSTPVQPRSAASPSTAASGQRARGDHEGRQGGASADIQRTRKASRPRRASRRSTARVEARQEDERDQGERGNPVDERVRA